MSSDSYTVTALIPTYNRAAYLPECLDSLLAQSRPPEQIIVVNDGSTDATKDVVAGYGDRILLIDKPNGGKSSAIIEGMKQCVGDLIWICDDDDVADKEGLAALVAAFEADPSLDIAMGLTQEFYDRDDQRHFVPRGPLLRAEESSIKLNFLEEMRTGVFAMLVRRAHYERTGSYRVDLVRSQDYDMTLRLLRAGKAACVDQVIYYYRQHQGVRGTSKEKTAATEMKKRWFDFNKKIFQTVLDDYTLEEFTPSFAKALSPDLRARAAHVERAVIFLRHGFWRTFSQSLAEILSTKPPEPLSEQEIHLASTAIISEIALPSLWQEPGVLVELRRLYGSSPYAPRLIQAFFGSIGYVLLRQLFLDRDFRLAFETTKAMARIMGWADAIVSLITSCLRGGLGQSGAKKIMAVLRGKK